MMTQAEQQRIKQELREWLHREIDSIEELSQLRVLQEAIRGDVVIS